MSWLKSAWAWCVNHFELGPRTLKGRLTEGEAVAIGRRAIGVVFSDGPHAEEQTTATTGSIPAAAFERDAPAYEGYVEVQLERHSGKLVWEATTNQPGYRGGHAKVLIDDETGKVLRGYIVGP